MPSAFTNVGGIRSGPSITPRQIFVSGSVGTPRYVPSNIIISGAITRDVGNIGAVTLLRPGLMLGKVTSGGQYANAILGVTDGAVSTTTVTLSDATVGAEIVRRIGASGDVKLIGPPAASGVVRSLTAHYSSISGTTMTITSLNVNEVQTLTFGATATGGAMVLEIPLANGTVTQTGTITWNGTDATWLSAINTALDAATGVSGAIVATGAAPDDVITFTFSGTGYAGLPATGVIAVLTKPTSVTTTNVVRTTTGQSGAFATGSIIAPTDGSQVPLTLLSDSTYPIEDTTDLNNANQQNLLNRFLVAADLYAPNVINLLEDAWGTAVDTSVTAYYKSLLNANGNVFTFSDDR